MTWKPVADLSKKEVAEFYKEFGQKARFLLDENISLDLVDVLRELGWKVKHVAEVGLKGHSDEDVFTYARDHDLVLLTKDLDFKDDIRFPLYRNPGTVILPAGQETRSVFINAIQFTLNVVGKLRLAYRHSKVVITEDEVLISSRNPGTSTTERRRLRMTKGGDILEWIEEDTGE